MSKIELIKETFPDGTEKFWIYKNGFPVDGAETETLARILYKTICNREHKTTEVLESITINQP